MTDRNIFNVSSHGQMGGITAGQVNIGRTRRMLGDYDKTEIRKLLAQHGASKEIEVFAPMPDGIAQDFARQIIAFLQGEGYRVLTTKGPNLWMGNPAPPEGVTVSPKPDGRGIEIAVGHLP